MTLLISVLALWMISMCLVTYLFCGAAREFLSAPEMELLPVKYSTTIYD